MSRWSTPEQARALCVDRAFTPGRNELDPLIELLASVDRDAAKDITAALVRAGSSAANIALAKWGAARPPLRARLIELVGRMAQRDSTPIWQDALTAAAADSDLATARKAIVMLGKLPHSQPLPGALEELLIGRCPDAPAALQRAIVETLGKKGSERALRFVESQSDPIASAQSSEDRRVRSRAALMLQRAHKKTESRIALNKSLPHTLHIALECRAGLGRLLALEAKSLARSGRNFNDRVEFDYHGTIESLLAARTALHIAIPVPLPRTKLPIEQRVVAALKDEGLQGALLAWTDGVPRFRVSWHSGGHRRGATWALAKLVSEQVPQLLNDPNDSCWECRIDDQGAHPQVTLIPKLSSDPRFAYRQADVPAASHPTIAAALALQAAPQPDDIVWDPFVGSAQELIEIARRCAVRALHGTDVDPRALKAASANITAAQVPQVQLQLADARSVHIANVSLIVSNPPMGRRVARDGALLGLLDDFLGNAQHNLRKGGRVVWLSPAGEHTAKSAARLGFLVERLEAIDLGGFSAELQVLRR